MNKLYLYILAFIVFIGMGASWVIEKANASHEIPIIKKVPNFNFTNQNGELFSHNQLKNKITVLFEGSGEILILKPMSTSMERR